jgi:hypothetical protein
MVTMATLVVRLSCSMRCLLRRGSSITHQGPRQSHSRGHAPRLRAIGQRSETGAFNPASVPQLIEMRRIRCKLVLHFFFDLRGMRERGRKHHNIQSSSIHRAMPPPCRHRAARLAQKAWHLPGVSARLLVNVSTTVLMAGRWASLSTGLLEPHTSVQGCPAERFCHKLGFYLPILGISRWPATGGSTA